MLSVLKLPMEENKVKVRFPWWHALSTKDVDVATLIGNIEEELNKTIPEVPQTYEVPTEEVAFYYNKISAQILHVIGNIIKPN